MIAENLPAIAGKELERRKCDELDGHWHRHTHTASEEHDTSEEGQRPVEISEFLDEVENVLAALDLP